MIFPESFAKHVVGVADLGGHDLDVGIDHPRHGAAVLAVDGELDTHTAARLVARDGQVRVGVAKVLEDDHVEGLAKGADIVETSDVKEALSQSDFVYVTRVQRERFPDEESYLRCKGSYIVNNELLKCAKKDITIMHPLPRVDEIATEVDSYPGAAYFRQAHNGMYLRMALLGLITGRI